MTDRPRKLVAILFSDIAGYTADMGKDEHRAIEAVTASRAMQRQLVEEHRGRWIQAVGDGVLCTFESAVEAVECALAIQLSLGSSTALRIGIHAADIVFQETAADPDIFGDGVNLAARIQSTADPGQVLVSERVCEDLRNHPEFHLKDLGPKRLKNVARPIRIFRVSDPGTGPSVRRPLRAVAAVASLSVALGLGIFIAFPWSEDPTVRAADPANRIDVAAAGSPLAEAPSERPGIPPAPFVREGDEEGFEPVSPTGPRVHITANGRDEPEVVPRSRTAEPTRAESQAPPLPAESRDPMAADEAGDAPTRRPPETEPPQVAAPPPAGPARAAVLTRPEPESVVREAVDRVLQVLREPGRPSYERLRRIEHIAYAYFDFETFSKLVLLGRWKSFTTAEQEEFIRSFEIVLAQRYSGKIEAYDHETVEILDRFKRRRGEATVRTAIVDRRGVQQATVDYRMRAQGPTWRVIDVTIEGVSLVSNYRDQFDSILGRGGSIATLLSELRRRIDAQRQRGIEVAGKTTSDFESVRKALLEASSNWPAGGARVWVDPNVVKADGAYAVEFATSCDCFAYLFAIHDGTQAIRLLHPIEPSPSRARVAAGRVRSVRTRPATEIRELGGHGVDTLALIVTPDSVAFPSQQMATWLASPSLPSRVRDLRSFLDGLGARKLDAAFAHVRIEQ